MTATTKKDAQGVRAKRKTPSACRPKLRMRLEKSENHAFSTKLYHVLFDLSRGEVMIL